MAELNHIMKLIGFRGFGDHSGVGKSIFLALVFSFIPYLFFLGAADELLLMGNPAVSSFFDGISRHIVIILAVIAAVSFCAVFWRHLVLIILLVLLSATGLFGIVHAMASEGEKFIPKALTAAITPERAKEIETLRTVRLARIKDSYFEKDVFDMMNPFASVRTTLNEEPASPGDIVIVTKLPGEKSGYIVRFKGKEKEWRNVNDLALIRIDRAAFLRHECALLKWAAEYADVVKDIPGGRKVFLTGNTSADGLAVEVTHNGDTGWLRAENLNF